MYQIKIEEIASSEGIVISEDVVTFNVTEENSAPGNRLVGGFLGDDPRVQVIVHEKIESAFNEETEAQVEPLDLSTMAVRGYVEQYPSTSASVQEPMVSSY